MSKKIKRNKGAAMLISVVFFLFISIAIIAGLVGPTVRVFRNSVVNLNSKKSYFLAESGIEDTLYRIKSNYAVPNSNTITLGLNTATTTVTTLVGNSKQIVTQADVSSEQRKITALLKTGDGAVFKYGTQAGQGGFIFANNAYVLGSIYSNGNIVGSNGAYITGDAFVAGSTGSIDNMCVGGTQGSTCDSTTAGEAHAHTVTNTKVVGALYCQVGSGNNKACNTSQADPVAQDLPISDDEIASWKTDASSSTPMTGPVTISTPTTLGPTKINGDLIISNTLTIANTIYVTGNVTIHSINNTPSIKLNSSYGASSGMIIADGRITIDNGVTFNDSGTAGSYILLLSTSDCDESNTTTCGGQNAIDVSNNSNISIVNAQKGTVSFSNNASVKESVGAKIRLRNNVHISYGSGVISVGFTSGPSGSWVIDSWGESQ